MVETQQEVNGQCPYAYDPLTEKMFTGIGNFDNGIGNTVLENSNDIFGMVLGKCAEGYSFDDMEPIWMVASVVIDSIVRCKFQKK